MGKSTGRSFVFILGLVIWALCITDIAWAKIPIQPSDVYVQGRQLMVRRRFKNNTLDTAKPYIIKGVGWNPATMAPATGPNPANPAVSIPYGFFFDRPDVMNYWISQQHAAQYRRDANTIRRMGANTVRILSVDNTIPVQVLDKFYTKGIMVIMTVALTKDHIDSGKYLQVVNTFKNHPAILMWALGNEWDMNLYYNTYPNLSSAMVATQSAAAAIKAIDAHHPVASCLGDNPALIQGIVVTCSNVDLWGFNIYRGLSFGDFFTNWLLASTKPFYFSEFGTDSYRTTSYVADAGRAKQCVGLEDQLAQSSTDLTLWNEIKNNLSAYDYRSACSGGLIHEFVDQLWKVGNYNVGLGGIIEYGTPLVNHSYDDYNPEGFIVAGHPDGVANEEYFGVLNFERKPKIAYNTLRELYLKIGRTYISSLSPTSGSSGQQFQIAGFGFGNMQGQSVVKFGPTTASVVSWSDTSITCIVPAIAKKSYKVSVSAAGVESKSKAYKVK